MTAITALKEYWDNAAADGVDVSTSNCFIDTAPTGVATAKFSSAYTYNGHRGVQVVASGNYKILKASDIVSAGVGHGGWRMWPYVIEGAPSATISIAVTELSTAGTPRHMELQLTTARLLRIRDSGSAQRWISTAALAAGTLYYIAIRTDFQNARCIIFNGVTGGVIEDSGPLTNTGFDKATVDTLKLGPQSAVTLTSWYGEVTADDSATVPVPPVLTPTGLAYTRSIVHKVDASATAAHLTLTKVSGPTATVVESPTNVFTITTDFPQDTDLLYNLTDGSVTDPILIGAPNARLIKIEDAAGVFH